MVILTICMKVSTVTILWSLQENGLLGQTHYLLILYIKSSLSNLYFKGPRGNSPRAKISFIYQGIVIYISYNTIPFALLMNRGFPLLKFVFLLYTLSYLN